MGRWPLLLLMKDNVLLFYRSKMSPELGFELMTAKVPLVDCGASLGPVKAEKSVQHTALQTTVKHRRNRARKSAGRIKKVSQTPILMNSGTLVHP